MPPRNRWTVLAIIAGAWLIRLGLLVPLHDSYYQSGLSVMFDDSAASLLHGEGLVSHPDRWPLFQQEQARQWRLLDGQALRAMPREPGAAYPFIAYMPGYSVLLSLTYWVTGYQGYLPLQFLQTLLDASTCGVVAWLGAHLVSRPVGVVAAALYALYLPSARLSFVPLPDALMPLLVTGGFALWLVARQRPHWRWSVGCGAVWGVATLIRPDALLLPVILGGAWCLLDGRRMWRRAGLSIAACGLVLAPWVGRNVAVFHQVVLTKPGIGINLLELLGKYDPTNRLPGTDEELARREGHQNLFYPDGLGRDRQRFAEAMTVIRQQPLRYATLVMRQVPRLFFGNFFGILPGPEWSDVRRHGSSWVSYVRDHPLAASLRALRRLSNVMEGLIVLGAVLGVWALCRARRWRALALASLIPLYYVVVHVPMFTVARYFLPAVPCFLVLTAIGWMTVCKVRWAS